MKLLQAFDLVADRLEAAMIAIQIGQALHDGIQRRSHGVNLLRVLDQTRKIARGIRHKDELDLFDLRIFLILLNIVAADALKRDAALDSLLADTHLLPLALRRDAEHIALREHMVFDKFHGADGLIHLVVRVADIVEMPVEIVGRDGVQIHFTLL